MPIIDKSYYIPPHPLLPPDSLGEGTNKNCVYWGWTDGSVVRSPWCSCRALETGSQLSMTLVPGDLTPLSGLHGTRHIMEHIYTDRQTDKILVYRIFLKKKSLKIAGTTTGAGLN